MDRRGFLGSILALAAAPAIVRADSLMRLVPVETTVVVPSLGNRLLTIEEITREALRIAHEQGLADMELLLSGWVVAPAKGD